MNSAELKRIADMDNTTETLARRLGLRPQTLRAAICRSGHYYGLRPTKLPNGRLLWPDNAFELLTQRRVAA